MGLKARNIPGAKGIKKASNIISFLKTLPSSWYCQHFFRATELKKCSLSCKLWVFFSPPGVDPVATHHLSPQSFGCFSAASRPLSLLIMAR